MPRFYPLLVKVPTFLILIFFHKTAMSASSLNQNQSPPNRISEVCSPLFNSRLSSMRENYVPKTRIEVPLFRRIHELSILRSHAVVHHETKNGGDIPFLNADQSKKRMYETLNVFMKIHSKIDPDFWRIFILLHQKSTNPFEIWDRLYERYKSVEAIKNINTNSKVFYWTSTVDLIHAVSLEIDALVRRIHNSSIIKNEVKEELNPAELNWVTEKLEESIRSTASLSSSIIREPDHVYLRTSDLYPLKENPSFKALILMIGKELAEKLSVEVDLNTMISYQKNYQNTILELLYHNDYFKENDLLVEFFDLGRFNYSQHSGLKRLSESSPALRRHFALQLKEMIRDLNLKDATEIKMILAATAKWLESIRLDLLYHEHEYNTARMYYINPYEKTLMNISRLEKLTEWEGNFEQDQGKFAIELNPYIETTHQLLSLNTSLLQTMLKDLEKINSKMIKKSRIFRLKSYQLELPPKEYETSFAIIKNMQPHIVSTNAEILILKENLSIIEHFFKNTSENNHPLFPRDREAYRLGIEYTNNELHSIKVRLKDLSKLYKLVDEEFLKTTRHLFKIRDIRDELSFYDTLSGRRPK